MSTQLLIISDIHTNKETSGDILDKLLSLDQIVCLENLAVKNLIVVCAGDITQCGQKEEFDEFNQALEMFIEQVKEKYPTLVISIICVPGNHDTNLVENKDLYDELCSYPYEESKVKLFAKRQDNFFEFYNSIDKDVILDECRIYWERNIFCENEHSIRFKLFNSSSLIKLDQEKGTLFFPCNLLGKNNPKTFTGITIAVIHHPLSWFEIANQKELQRHIEKESNILITGHDHLGETYTKHSHQETTLHVESQVFNDQENKYQEEIISVYIEWDNPHEIKWNEYKYYWDKESFKKCSGSPIEEIISKKNIQDGYSFSEEHLTWLDRLPTLIKHPKKELLTLEDIFVYPMLQRIGDKNKKTNNESHINSECLLCDIKLPLHCLIHGDAHAGKTMLAKQYVKCLFKQGKVPLYVDCSRIGNKDIISFINENFQKQYLIRLCGDEYFRIDRSQTAILLDNFDHEIKKHKDKAELLKQLAARSDIVFVFASEVSSFGYIANPEIYKILTSTYVSYKILELNHKTRNQLLTKWSHIDLSGTIDTDELEYKILDYEKNINNLFGKSLVPKYPLYISFFLQAMSDSGQISQSQIGTYGGLYEIVIRQQLAKVITRRFDLQTLSNYLGELAYYLYKKDIQSIDELQYREFADHFNKEYGTTFNSDKIIQTLIDSGIISVQFLHNGEKYSFQYDYFFYYFVAKYMSSNINNKSIEMEIKKLCNKFYHDRYANIWLFLTHLSSDKCIIETIVEHAQSLFSNLREIEFDKDIDFAERLRKENIDMQFIDDDYKRLKEKRLEDEDEFEIIQSSNPLETKDEDIEDPIVKLVTAFKTVDILGQLLRNFTGTLKASDKVKLLEETYKLSLRIIEFVISTFREHSDAFIEYLASETKENGEVLSKEEVIEQFSTIVYTCLQMHSFYTLHKVATSVSHPQLVLPYQMVQKKMPKTNSLILLHSLVNLNASKRINDFITNDDLKHLQRKIFCHGILRYAVIHFCYMYPLKNNLKQSICEKFGIKYKTLFLLENKKK